MMAGVGSWLLSITGASVLCALADGLMPAGPVRRVGRLVCGLMLLAVILAPLAQLDLEGGQRWLEEYHLLLLRDAQVLLDHQGQPLPLPFCQKAGYFRPLR